ncbi:MAG: class I SAM-dependent methyltransferase [Faecalibacterium sp.]
MDRPYYLAYDVRYRAVHAQGRRWSSQAPTPVVQEILKETDPDHRLRLLEVGCGEGRDALPLLVQGYDLLAVDVSPEAVSYCQAQCPPRAQRFRVLDCLREKLPETFDFIFAVAVLHMLVKEKDRAAFYGFVRDQLSPQGTAVVCTMGDGIQESETDPEQAFQIVQRRNGEELWNVAQTSCRVVNWETFRTELHTAGFTILRQGTTCVPGAFPKLMFAVVTPNGGGTLLC